MATSVPTSPAQIARNHRIFLIFKTLGAVFLLVVMVADVILGVLFYWRPLWVINEVLHARLSLAGIHSEYVIVGPYRVHYFVGGHGQPLLLIHGLGARAEDWTPEMPAYAKHGFRVYAIDLLGSGGTDRPDIAYTMQQQAELVYGFLDAVHVQQADVVGWSMGGWVAFQFALDHPDRVQRLVAMDSVGLTFPNSLTPEMFEPRTVPQLKQLEALLVQNPPWLPEFFYRAFLREMQRNFPVVHRTVKSMFAKKDVLDGRLGALRMPVLIVWGAQDNLIPPSVGLRMHRAIPQSVMEFYSDCGHIGPATCAGRIVPRVLQFLHSEPPATGGTYTY